MVLNNSFTRNGLKYINNNDTVLLYIKDKTNGKYISIDMTKDKMQFKIDKVRFTNNINDAYLFLVSKENFDDFGITSIVHSLKRDNADLVVENLVGELFL